jgi:hypothetical protein
MMPKPHAAARSFRYSFGIKGLQDALVALNDESQKNAIVGGDAGAAERNHFAWISTPRDRAN